MRPTLSCLKRIGPPDSIAIAQAIAAMIGAKTMSPTAEASHPGSARRPRSRSPTSMSIVWPGGRRYYELHDAGFKYKMLERRREIADAYDAALAALDPLELPVRLPQRGHAHHLYVLKLRPAR